MKSTIIVPITNPIKVVINNIPNDITPPITIQIIYLEKSNPTQLLPNL
jgi:hypothetical protein